MLQSVIDLYENNQAEAWTPDPERVKSLALPNISQAAPGLMNQPDRDTFLWRALYMVMSTLQPGWRYRTQFQKQGTCGGQSAKSVWDMSTANTCLLMNQAFPGRSSVAGFYTGSRVEVARKPGKWQGTCGCWLAEFAAKFGAVLLKDMQIDENYYYPTSQDPDEKFAMAWTNSWDGVPVKYEQLAKRFPSGAISQPRNAREAGKLIEQGIGVITGNDLIPTGKRNRQGFGDLRQVSGHLTGYIAVRYNPFGLLYLNSWGDDWASGPVYVEDQPPGTVWLDEDQCNAQISQGDTFGIGGTMGMPDLYIPACKSIEILH